MDKPIGIFDSGVGGLTVFKAISSLLPNENLLYLGDTARVPYGTKSRETIIRYTLMAAQKLVDRGIKLLVIACNTATSAALPNVAEYFAPIPVLGVVEPGARAAVAASRSGRIAVIGTEATIMGGAYQSAIHKLDPNAIIVSRPCTLLVPLAEEGWLEGEAPEAILKRYLADLFEPDNNGESPDTLLLGCTHFPLFKSAIQKLVGSHVKIVDSASATADSVEAAIIKNGLARKSASPGNYHFLTTDNIRRFASTGGSFLGHPLTENGLELVDL